MKLLYSGRPKSRSVVFTIIVGLIICFFIFSYLAYYIDYLFRYNQRFCLNDYLVILVWIIIGIVIGILSLLYYIGEVRWQIKGEEKIFYNTNYLYIVNKGRVFGKFKKIPFQTIKKVDKIQLSIYEHLIVFFSVSGDIDERIQITRYKKRKIYCGVNISEKDCEAVIEILQKQIKTGSRNSNSNSIQ